MKKIISGILMLAFIMTFFTACRTKDNLGEYPVTIGNVIIGEQPKTIVCMSDTIADIAIACGYAPNIAARSEECDQNAIFPLPTVGTSEHPDVEAIVNMGCDLLLADDSLSEDAKTALSSAGINVLSLTEASTRDELTRMYSNICAAFAGNETGRAAGEKKIENLYTSIDELGRQIPESNIINTACYIYNVDGDTVSLATGDTFASKLIEYTNSTNIGAGAINLQMDASSVKMQNPKFIFCAPGVKEKLKEHETLSKLYALSEDNVFVLEETAMTRQGNTILSTVEFMVKSMYPELSGSGDEKASDTDESSDTQVDISMVDDTDSQENTDSGSEDSSDIDSSSAQGEKYRVNSDDGLKLRSSPDLDGEIILGMEDKTVVTLLEDLGNGWFKVQTEDGTTGYCSSEFLVKE